MNPATPIPQPRGDPERFFSRLAGAARCALLLDYDGTLAPFHLDPKNATPYPGVRQALDAILHQHDTRLVVISGRWTRDLLPLLSLAAQPEVWGSHGWERCFPDGRCLMPEPGETARRALAEAERWSDAVVALGARPEPKPVSLAIHWRGLDAGLVARIHSLVREYWILRARDQGLTLHEFDGGLELRVPGRHKGDAVDTLRAEMPGALFAYLGDDLTDEDAFQRLGGDDLGVLVRSEPRPTRAHLHLTPPAELLAFLQRWIEARQEALRATARA
jgi:trehalose-phosphatase